MTTAMTPQKQHPAARLALQQQLLEAWDHGDWLQRLHHIAKEANENRATVTQGRHFQNACASARAYSDVLTFIYGQIGKAHSPWVVKGWPDKLLKLLEDLRAMVFEISPNDEALPARLLRQSHVLLLYRKVGETFAAFIAYEEKSKKAEEEAKKAEEKAKKVKYQTNSNFKANKRVGGGL